MNWFRFIRANQFINNMLLRNSKTGQTCQLNAKLAELLARNDPTYLEDAVKKIAIPRHYIYEKANNEAVGKWIEEEFQRCGLRTFRQGEFDNIVASTCDTAADATVLIGAHFDSVPGSPGADDNASAVAGMLAAAKVLTPIGQLPITFVAFNREEDGLLGSIDFVNNYLIPNQHKIKIAHVLEMIGYCDATPGSQSMPAGLPIKIGDVADFIGIIMNKTSNKHAALLRKTAEKFIPDLPVKTLEVFFGMEKMFPHLLRSDHSPFWNANISALMWTDTSEFRNAHYHQYSDTPDTLDYAFMKKVSDLLIMHVVSFLKLDKYS